MVKALPGPMSQGSRGDPRSVGLYVKSGSFPWSLRGVSELWEFVDRLPVKRSTMRLSAESNWPCLMHWAKAKADPLWTICPAFCAPNVRYGAILPLGTQEKNRENEPDHTDWDAGNQDGTDSSRTKRRWRRSGSGLTTNRGLIRTGSGISTLP